MESTRAHAPVQVWQAAAAGRRRRARAANRDAWVALLFLAPNLVGFLVFTALPILAALSLSFINWDFQLGSTFVGLAHYKRLLLNDPTFRKVLLNTVMYVAGYLPLNIVVALALALALNRTLRGMILFRTIYFLPVMVTMVAAALVWRWMYDYQFGIVNYFLSLLGLGRIPWLVSTRWPIPAIILMSVWKGLGYNMVIFLAGLQAIPRYLYEAAALDGAGGWRKFVHVTLPLLSPTTFFAIVITVIASFQVFDQALIMTEGGPADASNTIVLYIYQNAFQFFNLSYGAALGWVLFAIVFLFTLAQWRMQQEWVFYE